MILAIDVQYLESTAFAAGVLFENWDSAHPASEYSSIQENIADYEPGSFYKRELPCILKLLSNYNLAPETIVVDGYVYLDGTAKPGLGKRLFDALSYDVLVVGVAKKAFDGINSNNAIYRGKSKNPLYVTSTGDLDTAKSCIASMTGDYRIPDLLKRADQLCRDACKN